MARKIPLYLEQRLKNVVKTKIRRLKEANSMSSVNPEDDEEFMDTDDTTDVSPVSEPSIEPMDGGMDGGMEPEPNIGFNNTSSKQTGDVQGGTQDISAPEIEPMEPQSDPTNNKDINRAKVRLFFDKLGANETLMGYLSSLTSEIEQAEAIMSFAQLVGVPKSRFFPVMKSLRDIMTEPEMSGETPVPKTPSPNGNGM